MWMRAGFGEIGTLQDVWLTSCFLQNFLKFFPNMFDPQLVESMDQEEPMDTEGQLYIFCKYFLPVSGFPSHTLDSQILCVYVKFI